MAFSDRLNTRIIVQAKQAGTDASGQPNTGWIEVARPWADIEHRNGVGTIKADTQASVVRASFRIRYRTDIVAGMRAVIKRTGAVYRIEAVVPDEKRQRHVDLVCELTK